MVRKSPTFTILAALSLALGIGANTAIYSFLDAIFLRSLPVEQPEQLAVIQYHTKEFPKVAHGFSGSNFRDANRGMVSGNIPYPAYEALRDANQVFSSVADPLALVPSVRELVRQADSRIPITNITTQERVIEQTVGQERTFATLCTGFALLAMAIACVGLYRTMAYNVARRSGEIGIRMALGAQRNRVLWMVEREVLWLAAAGLAVGIPIAYGAARVVETFLFGVKARDLTTLIAAPLLLLVAALLAGWAPARRASRVDAMTALRED